MISNRCALLLLVMLLPGCAHPSEDNIRLRKQNQDLQAQVDRLTTENDAHIRQVISLLARSPTVPTLSAEDLKKLWVTAGLDIGRFSGGVDLDPAKPGDEGVRVYVTPTDVEGNPIQAAGSFMVEAFDLAEKGDNSLGRWTWDVKTAKTQWRAFLLESAYQLTCPWQKMPRHGKITVRVTFTDELTHTSYSAEKVVQANIPPAETLPPGAIPAASSTSAPTTSPAR